MHRASRILLVLAAALLGALVVPSVSAAATPRAQTLLPADPKAHGYVGLCDEAGHNVTGGSVTTKPFVWKAVASVPPPSAYRGKGENAVLDVFQPRPQVQPAYWSGASITAASFYQTPQHPAVQATYEDESLADVIAQYPAQVDGLYQLRIYYGKANYGLYSATYPATTIQVTGRTWTVVSGGTVDCSAAKGVSNGQLTGVVSKKDTVPRKPPASERTVAAGGARRIAATPARIPSGDPSAAQPGGGGSAAISPVANATHHSTGGRSWGTWALIALVVLLAAALLVVLLLRRSNPATNVTERK